MDFESLIGQVIDGKYKIERQLGKGGMGTVYLATHVGTERPVAVKVIVPQFMERAEFVERFRREARAAGRLRHPNVVDVTDFGIAEGGTGKIAYLVMEYLDGCTLGEILDEEKHLPLSWSLDILEQVCSAVHEAHQQGIIHRDLKPDNIWLEPNQRGGYTVKVLDFGIAKLEESHAGENGEGDIHISVLPTVGINYGETIPDRGSQVETIADGRSSAAFMEKGTAVLQTEAGTLIQEETDFSEKGTAILESGEINSEDGTAIFPSKRTQFVQKDDGTRMFSPGDTDKSPDKVNATSELTRVGAVLGTPLYMSPEQCRGEHLSARSDIYSLGVIAYQMLGGKTPFEGDFTSVMEAHRELEPPHLEANKVPRKVKKVISSALSKNPDERPPTAHAFSSKLRSYSDGIGALMTRALVIYSERLPKFLLLTILTSIPILILSAARIVYSFLQSVGMVESSAWMTVISTFWGIATFFVQIFTAAFLVGITTWIVAQVLAVPLRPINLRTAFKKAGERRKPLLKTVTASTLLAMVSWGMGAVVGGLISLPIVLPMYFYVSGFGAIAIGVLFAGIGSLGLGLYVSAAFMLVAPSIMMEGISGKAAFRRSVTLVNRSFRTVLAAALLNYFVPAVLGFIMALAIGGIVNKFEPEEKSPSSQEATEPGRADGEVNVQLDQTGVKVTTDKKPEQDNAGPVKLKPMGSAFSKMIFEILWLPVVMIITSFTSVITALIYFKTRQAGGETMQDLLEQFEDRDRPKSKWQERVEHRLIQSGRVTSRPSKE